ncbi:MAG: hypothetical protein CM15mL4_2980 [uncultured marine virus]|nr:MAG: hypothetical protein CM15mL4_2980 [uncultured marine virus]
MFLFVWWWSISIHLWGKKRKFTYWTEKILKVVVFELGIPLETRIFLEDMGGSDEPPKTRGKFFLI